MMETVFGKVAKKKVEVFIKRSIGKGDDVCEFIIKLSRYEKTSVNSADPKSRAAD